MVFTMVFDRDVGTLEKPLTAKFSCRTGWLCGWL